MDAAISEQPNRQTWSSHIGYILSLFGYLSGAGDFWGFPYLFWTNGGGAFMIAYLLALVVCSLPVYYLEVALPQYSGKGMYDIWCICPLFSGICYTMLIINVEMLLVFPVIRVWIVAYIRHSFSSVLPWTTCGNSWNTDACIDNSILHNASYVNHHHYNTSYSYLSTKNATTSFFTRNISTVSSEEEFWFYKILHQSSGIGDWGSIQWELCLYNLLLRGLVVLCVIKSIKSIEKVMYITTFVPILLLVAIMIRALTLPGSTEGLLFFITPDFSKFLDKQMWMQAAFAGLNTVSIGMGGTMVIASKGKFQYGIFKSMMWACSLDAFGSIFTCCCLFTVLGVMAADQGKPLATVVTSGTSVGFVGFTRAFSYLPEAKAWSILFFCCAFVALLDVTIMTKETVVDFIMQAVPCLHGRHRLVVISVFVMSVVLSLPLYTQAGPYLYQIINWYYGTWCVLITTLLECIIFMWIFGIVYFVFYFSNTTESVATHINDNRDDFDLKIVNFPYLCSNIPSSPAYGGESVDDILQTMIGRKMPGVLRLMAAFVCPLICLVFLGISIATFRPPVYGDYNYPAGAVVFGYMLGILPVLPIPIVMALKVSREKGTLKQKIVTLLKPSRQWGTIELAKGINDAPVEKTERSLVDTAYYNTVGRKRRGYDHHDHSLNTMI